MPSLRSMAAVAAALSRRYGLNVTCSGAGAWTSVDPVTGKMTVNIPASVSTDGDALLLLRGYLDHECGHARWTDFNAPTSTMDPLIHTLANIFEDVRVEALMSDAFEGAKENLHAIAAKLFGGSEWKSRAEHADQAACIVAWLLWHVRKDACPEMEHGEQMLRGFVDAHAPGLADDLLRELSFHPRDTTESCWQAARDCARLMRNYSGQDRFDGQQNQTKEEQDRTEQAVRELARGNGRRADKVKDNIEKLAQRQLVADSARSFSTRDVEGSLPTPEKGMAGVVNEALDRDNPSQGASCSSADASHTGSPEDCVASGDAYAETPEERARADAVRSCLGRRLEALLQTQGSVRRGGARQGRRLDSRSLWKAGARDGRVFERTSQGHAPEAAVLVLMDQSGSMRAVYDERGNCVDSPVPGSQPIDWANAACSGLLDALRSIRGIQAGLCAFSNQYSVLVPMGSGPRRGLRVSATASGGTAIGRAIIDCSGMLPPQAKRKIMIVLTDGQEGSVVADAVQQANDLGVEVAGVGIGPAAPIARIVPVSRTVTSPDGIPDALCGVLRDLLVESGR